MRKGTLYVFTGPSGAGKGTVLGRLLAEDDRLFFSISATTRAPRPGEQNGVHYYFLEKADFENRIAQGAFLEHAQYVGNYYGTLEAPVNEKLDEGFDVILEIEVQGAMQIKKKRPDAVMVFIAPPSFEELASRLRGRGTEDEAKVQKRLETAKGELEQKDKFDYVVVNDTVDRAGNIRRFDYNAEPFDAGTDETSRQPLSAGQSGRTARARHCRRGRAERRAADRQGGKARAR